MIALVILAALVGMAVGASIEAHLCTHRRQVIAWKQYATAVNRTAVKYRGAARHWYHAYKSANRTAEAHAGVLAALGRAVAEGRSIESTEGTDNA